MSHRKKKKKRERRRNPPLGCVCWLCDYPIRVPKGSWKPLSYTRDHVIARANGGIGGETKPAHRICNMVKGHQDATDEVRAECRRRVEELMERRTLLKQSLILE